MNYNQRLIRETENARFYADGMIELKNTPTALALLGLLEVLSQRQDKEPARPPSEARPTRLLSRREAAERLGISLSTYKLLAAREKLREVRVGRRRLVAETEIERLIRDS